MRRVRGSSYQIEANHLLPLWDVVECDVGQRYHHAGRLIVLNVEGITG